MFYKPRPFLTLAFACSLLVGACESSTPATKTPDMKPAHSVKDGALSKPAELTKEIAATPVNANSDMSGDKIAALQQQVAALQQEVAANRPKIAKIDVMEQKFKDLSLGLDRIDATYGMQKSVPMIAPAPMPTPAPVAAVEKPATPVPDVKPPAPPAKPPVKEAVKAPEAPKAAESGKPVVKDVRIGEQKGFSRLVLDLGKTTKVSYDIDNDEKILLIDIPGFTWEGAKTRTITNSPLISSYQVNSDDTGSHLVVQLKKPAKISNFTTITATAGKDPRAVLDIAAQ